MTSVSEASMPILEWAEKRVVALRRAQHIRSEQQGLGVTARVTWRPPPGPRSQVLTLASPQLKRSPHVTPKLMGSHSAQELLELSFGRLDRTRIGIDRSLQAQVDEAARVRAHLEAELAEQTASASQLEQACHARFSQLEQECTRLTAEMLEERTACEAEKDALEAALERNRSRLRAALKASMTLGLVALGVARDGERTSLTSGADAAAFEAATRSEQLNMAQEELWRARRQFASEVRKLRLGLKLMLTLGLAIKDARAASG